MPWTPPKEDAKEEVRTRFLTLSRMRPDAPAAPASVTASCVKKNTYRGRNDQSKSESTTCCSELTRATNPASCSDPPLHAAR